VSRLELRRRIQRRANRVHLDIPDGVLDGLGVYLDILATWNRKINLTSLSDPDEAVDRLAIEPLLAARSLPFGLEQFLDAGSGGGSPAIPLKLMAPGARLVMVESKVRKSAFLREVARQLGLPGVEVETCRFEELLARPEMHESMDLVSVRAVRLDEKALMTLQAFLRPGGQVFVFTSSSAVAEKRQLPQALEVEAVEPLVESLRSQLVRLRKRAFHVEHRP
jgi:16S rRNA (guanine527-N7)-methyltransferase